MKKSRFFRMITIGALLAALVCLMSMNVSAAELTGRLEGTPEELENHILLKHRGNGDCEEMTGSIAIMLLFVDEPDHVWTQQERDAYYNRIFEQTAQVEAAAAAYNVYPEFGYCYALASWHESLDNGEEINAAMDGLMSQAGLGSRNSANENLEKMYNVDEAVIFVVLNKEGRAYAYMDTSTEGAEFGVLFNDASAFWHEMNHLFGAVDFYYPNEVEMAADLYLGESIMYGGSNVIDEFTAYLIGWTDELHSCSRGFLYETAWLTQEYINEAIAGETITGYGVTTSKYGTYEGYMINGIANGQGTYKWNDGGSYTGQWDNGAITGYGTFCWTDGTVYEGEFLNGNMHGYGTMRYSNGYVCTGYWNNGQFLG